MLKLPRDHTQMTDTIQQVNSMEYSRDSMIRKAAIEVHQSLQDAFRELLGLQKLLAVADVSFNSVVINGKSRYKSALYWLLSDGLYYFFRLWNKVMSMVKIFTIQCLNHAQFLEDTVDDIAQVLGQDLFDKV